MGMQTNEILPALQQKNFQNYLAKVGRNSKKTRDGHDSAIRLLASFLQRPQPDDTIEIITKVDPYELLDAFTGWLVNQKYKNNSILQFVSKAKRWIRYHGIKIYNEDMQDRVELPEPEQALDEAPTKQQIRILLSGMDFQTQNKMLMLSCSGIRPADLQYLQWSNLKWDERPVRLIVPAKGKTRRGWETFITDELAERLQMQPNFKKSERLWKSANPIVLDTIFNRALQKHPEVDVVEERTRNGKKKHKIHLYSLKKYFFTGATAEVGDMIAQAWAGRKAYLTNYLRLKLEKRRGAVQQSYAKPDNIR